MSRRPSPPVAHALSCMLRSHLSLALRFASVAEGLVVASVGAAALLALTAGAASAGQVQHAYLYSFNGGSTPAGSFVPYGVYADNSSSVSAGDVYVNDGPHGVIDKFTATGSYQCQITGAGSASTSASECDTSAPGPGKFNTVAMDGQGAVDPATGDVWVPTYNANRIDEFGPGGSYLGQITPAVSGTDTEVAVDAAGDVFVADYGLLAADKIVEEYKPSTGAWSTFASATPSGTFGRIDSVAVDDDPTSPAYGDVYIGDFTNKLVYRFSSTGAYQCELTGAGSASNSASECDSSDPGAPSGGFSSIQSLTVDPGTGELYVADSSAKLVDQFEPSGAYQSQISLPNGGTPYAVTVSAANGQVYVADESNDRIDAFSADIPAPVITPSPASALSTSGATLNASVNPEGDTVTSCKFEYATAAQYAPSAANPFGTGASVPCTSTPTGSSPVAISASVSGLTAGTLYYYELVLTWSSGAVTGSVDGNAQSFGTGPVIVSQSASLSSATAATLSAELDPAGAESTYQFQYGTSTAYGASVPASPADIGSGSANVAVSQAISGLSAGTTYHWRVVATNSTGTVYGPDQTLTAQACANARYQTGPSAGLPDCRAYEQVTPQNKDDDDFGLIAGNPGLLMVSPQAAADGNAVAVEAEGGGTFGGAPANLAPQASTFLSRRGAGGWSTKSVNPPYSNPGSLNVSYEAYALSPDLSQLAFQEPPEAAPLSVAEPAGSNNGYLENTASGSYTLLTPTLPAGWTTSQGGHGVYPPFEYLGASTDFSRVVFVSNGLLTASANTNYENLYEYVNGQDVLVSVLPSGTDATTQPTLGSASLSANEIAGGSVNGAVSADGSHVYWTAAGASSGACTTSAICGNVYLSTVGADGDVSSVQVNASQAAPPDTQGSGKSQFWDAAGDGAVAFITSSTKLTDDATTGAADGGNDLYEYNATTGALTDITVDNNADDATGADVQGVAGVSSDGSTVYFVADGVLASGAQAGKPNLYVWHSGTTSYIATLSSADSEDWDGAQAKSTTPRVTPSGADIAFESTAQLTAYANNGLSEIYRYDQPSGTLTCVSCDPSGHQPAHGATFNQISGPTLDAGLYLPNNLSSNGDRVFFQDIEPLLGEAKNGLQNVYEWEADGTGSCSSAGGCLYLVSDGQGSSDSFFVDASASGGDAFIATLDQLGSTDNDQLNDLYDARVGGGFPAAPAAGTCTPGIDCQGAAPAPPPAPVAATVTFSGPGNPKPAVVTTSKVTASKRVTKKVIKGTSFVLAVKVPAKGLLTVSGPRVKRLVKKVGKAGSFRLTVRLSKAAIKRLEQEEARLKRAAKGRGKAKAKQTVATLKVRVYVAYKPTSGKASSVVVAVTVKA